MNKPRLAIVGLGQYYRKLESGIHKYFTPVLKADVAEVQAEGGRLRPLVLRSNPDAIMLLTPNHLHAKHILELADLRIPVFVDKPLVTIQQDLDDVLTSLHTNPLLYCSDFYPDVRAVPLLAWMGRPHSACLDKWISIVGGDQSLWRRGSAALGPIKHAEAVLLEGEGKSASFQGREWLWDPIHGGVLWDLAYHFLALIQRSFDETVSVVSSEIHNSGGSENPSAAETYAGIALESSSGKKFSLCVGKYQKDGNQRWFRITGEYGQALMTFADPNVLRINIGSSECTAVLHGSYYEHVAEAFREYVELNPSHAHGIDLAIMAIRLIAPLKQRLNEVRT